MRVVRFVYKRLISCAKTLKGQSVFKFALVKVASLSLLTVGPDVKTSQKFVECKEKLT